MTHEEIKRWTSETVRLIEEQRLKEAIDTLSMLIADLADWQLQERLSEIEANYSAMLRYLTDGAADPGRERIYNSIRRELYRTADLVALELKARAAWSVAYDYRRNPSRYFPEPSSQIIRAQDGEKLFNALRSAGLWTEDERQTWGNYLQNDFYPDSVRCLAVAALTLNLEELFDERKIDLLLEVAGNDNQEIRQRALTGLLLTLRRYDRRIALYPAIDNRLQAMMDNPETVRDVRNIILQFILSRETEKLSRIMKEEIMPGMMKISPILNKKIRMEDLFGETGIDEKNPEWQSLIEESGLAGRLQEFSELQMEGADVMHSSFLHLKNFPFFNSIHNWFLPFDRNHPMLDPKRFEGFADILAEASLLCNSDKYSFFFSLDQMPENYREMMRGQFASETESIREMLKEEMKQPKNRVHPAARQYIQDLYRFYKLFPRRTNIDDVFEAKPEFYQTPSIARFVAAPENMRMIGEYYFDRNYFTEAADIFSGLLEKGKDETLLQKRGYCFQMMGRIPEALKDYSEAELFNENNTWTVKKMAWCYRALKQPEEALACYRRAEKLSRDNHALEMSIGHCYLEMRSFDEALKRYFKVEYLATNKEKAWRPIAWCSFLCGKLDQAQEYFGKVLAANPNSTDYLNAGHVCFARHDIRQAVKHYTAACKALGGKFDDFLETFRPDIPDLVAAGVSEADIPVVLDSVLYEIRLG